MFKYNILSNFSCDYININCNSYGHNETYSLIKKIYLKGKDQKEHKLSLFLSFD